MLHVVLYEPEIPPNTGNIMRLCANAGATLHLVHPLGFHFDDKARRRASMDYTDQVRLVEHQTFGDCQQALDHCHWYAFSTRGKTLYHNADYTKESVLMFGPETRGLPEDVLQALPESQRLTLPMSKGSRSLNLSNSVAIGLYEAWRQRDFTAL